MPDLLANALAIAQAVRHRQLTTSGLIYARGDDYLTLDGTRGQSIAEAADADGVVMEVVSDDWIFRAEDLVLAGAAFEPRQGDRIDEITAAGLWRSYEVMPLAGAPCWRYQSAHRIGVRVHTKCVQQAQLLAWDLFSGADENLEGSTPDRFGNVAWSKLGAGSAIRDGMARLDAYSACFLDFGDASTLRAVARIKATGGGSNAAVAVARDAGGAWSSSSGDEIAGPLWAARIDPLQALFSIERLGADGETLADASIAIVVASWYLIEVTLDLGELEIAAVLKDDNGTDLASLTATDEGLETATAAAGLVADATTSGGADADYLRVEEVA